MKSRFKVFGNPNTKVCHVRSKKNDACRQRAVKESENFVSFEQASSPRFGYRACKRCRPDKAKNSLSDRKSLKDTGG